jgi:hypothetical protein
MLSILIGKCACLVAVGIKLIPITGTLVVPLPGSSKAKDIVTIPYAVYNKGWPVCWEDLY